MKPEIKQEWLDALRSGEYTYAKGSLKTEDADGLICHCVLGVLCDIHSKQTGTLWDKSDTYTHSDGQARIPYGGMLSSLPEEVCEWAGVEDSLVRFSISDDISCQLVDINDISESYEKPVEAIERYL